MRRWWRRFATALLVLPVVGCGVFFVAVRWRSYPLDRLEPRLAASLTLLDAQGEVLRQTATEAGGRTSWVALEKIAPHLVHATLAAEDHRFYAHDGVDEWALLRAVWLDLRAGRLAYGGSTLTMQLVRLVEPQRRGFASKLGEMVLARRLERALSKQQILEQYLNRAYYGHGTYGAEAASRFYFGKSGSELSLGEATLLAVLPRGPEAYDPFRHFDRALRRRGHVLGLLVQRGLVRESDRALAERTPLAFAHQRPKFRAPHFVDWVSGLLPKDLRKGATVRTYLDGPLQEAIEVAVREHLRSVSHLGISQAAVVVLRNRDGAVLSLVGSADYFDAHRSGAVNAAQARQRPGSTLKPFVYALALEKGDTPATVAYDVVLPHEVQASHTLDVKQHGPARYRESLSGSYNLAAVHTLERVGVRPLLGRLQRAGLTTLDWPEERYGVNLAIGEAEVRLVELTAAFATFGRGGTSIAARAVETAELPGQAPWQPERASQRVFAPDVAWLIFDILADPDARRPMFADRVPLHLPFPVALKTGTTRAYTDNWAVGTTAELTVGVWAGNFDGAPTHQIMAMRGAAPLLRAAFVALAARFGDPTAPPRPGGSLALVEGEVCPTSGLLPGPHCPARKVEHFLAGTVPDKECTWHKRACGRAQVSYPEEVAGWARAHGLLDEACPEVPTALRIVFPAEGAHFLLDPHRPAQRQRPPLRAQPDGASWRIDGVPADDWCPVPGEHVVEARLGTAVDLVHIRFE
jgi:penicillin-binding protein 1C